MFIELLVLPAGSLRGGEGRAWPPGATCGEERPGMVGATEGRGAASFPPAPAIAAFPPPPGQESAAAASACSKQQQQQHPLKTHTDEGPGP